MAEPAKEAPKVEPVKVEAPKIDAKPAASQILIMPPDKGWNGDRADRDSRTGERSGIFGKRRAAAEMLPDELPTKEVAGAPPQSAGRVSSTTTTVAQRSSQGDGHAS